MRLESALFTSREGLNVHGQAIGVIGDNISNVNTVGYKASRTEFADLVAEGTGTKQSMDTEGVGNGVQIGRVRQIHDTGVIEFTGRTLDVAIAGRGFFIVGDEDNQFYTRAGNFEMNEEGFLIDGRGLQVLGVPADAEEGSGLSALNLLDVDVSGTETSLATLSGNLDASLPITTPVTGATSFNQLNAAASFTTAFTVNDSLGAEHNVTMSFYKTGNNSWTAQAYMDAGETGGEAGVPFLLGQATLTFGSDGLIAEANQGTAIVTANPTFSNGASALPFSIDMTGFSQYASSSALSGVSQNGQGTGEIKNYEFKKDGRLVAVLSSGAEILIGTIKLADFTDLEALTRAGNNLYTIGGTTTVKDADIPGTGSLGNLEGSSLERSTVDLANQFVDLTLYQRGYQANSQILNAASSLIRDTLGLIR